VLANQLNADISANSAYFQRKIQLSGVFCISGLLAVPIIPDKKSSAVLENQLNADISANLAYFQRKIQLSGIFCLSGFLAVPITPDKEFC